MNFSLLTFLHCMTVPSTQVHDTKTDVHIKSNIYRNSQEKKIESSTETKTILTCTPSTWIARATAQILRCTSYEQK